MEGRDDFVAKRGGRLASVQRRHHSLDLGLSKEFAGVSFDDGAASRPQHRLANPIEIVRWNADKIYLHDLEKRGARIVPTIWKEKGIESRDAERWFDELETNELVLKPTVSANAESTARLTKGQVLPSALSAVFAGRPYMVQPFMRGIVDEGEFSLFYFSGNYNHTVLKTPTAERFPRPGRTRRNHSRHRTEPKLLAAGESDAPTR